LFLLIATQCTPSGTPIEAGTPIEVPPIPEPVELSYTSYFSNWTYSSTFDSVEQELADRFEETHPHVQVSLSYPRYSEEAETPADVFGHCSILVLMHPAGERARWEREKQSW
jgi:hypothetical protein